MSDIVSDIRHHLLTMAPHQRERLTAWQLRVAADEIERLRLAIRRLADQDATLSVCDGNVIVEMDAPEREAEPAALGVLRVGGGWVSIVANEVQAETSRQSWDKRENWVHEVVPLYRSPTLTDAEREAVEWCVEMAASTATDCADEIAALRGLLEKHGGWR